MIEKFVKKFMESKETLRKLATPVKLVFPVSATVVVFPANGAVGTTGSFTGTSGFPT